MNTVKRTTITCEQNLLVMLGADDRKQAERYVYKDTGCGAWIEFHEWGIRLGSIVEGCDFGTATYPLRYPFAPEDYDARIDAIEKESSALWEWANVTFDKRGRRHAYGKTMAESGMDAPDVDYNYRHLEPDGRSS